MIRGNLANGGALVDMRLTGTGLEPRIDGSVRLQNVEATLPFSRLEIRRASSISIPRIRSIPASICRARR